jgi:thiamine-monophosphate kinase
VLRGGARPGDDVFVTGTIGGSFRQHADADFSFPGGGKHLTFTPRTREATALADTLGESLHAMMDISDGLGLDAARLATRSNAAIELDANHIPLSPGQSDPLRAAAHGEDYELLFTAAPAAPVPATIAGTPLTRIGRVIAHGTGQPRCVLIHNGTRTSADALGWEHAG